MRYELHTVFRANNNGYMITEITKLGFQVYLLINLDTREVVAQRWSECAIFNHCQRLFG
jgi:hypothetical protein